MSHAHTFGSQSAAWLDGLRSRKRKPVSAATLSTYDSLLRRLAPFVGSDTKLADINNGFLRELGAKLSGSPKTICESLNAVKAVVASAVDGETGDPLYPRIWNHAFIDAPSIQKQRQPSLSVEQVNAAIKAAESWQEKILYAVLAGSGVRISEALAIRLGPVDEDQTCFLADESVIKVRASIFRGRERRGVLKTASARREMDLDRRLSTAIAAFVKANSIQPGQFLFQSRSGKVANLQTLVRRLKKREIPGFHSFRRFRATRLREVGVSEDILRFWLGHQGQSISDRYSKLAENVELRKQWAASAGLGFEVSTLGRPALRATRAANSPAESTPPYVATDADLPREILS
jgi:integrase